MRKTSRSPAICSEKCFETSTLACAKVNPGETLHFGSGSTYITGHSIGTQSFSHTVGSGAIPPAAPWHVDPGFTSVVEDCATALMSS